MVRENPRQSQARAASEPKVSRVAQAWKRLEAKRLEKRRFEADSASRGVSLPVEPH
jgi:hypothetical protein